jgi:hypothetical protein
VNHLRKINDLDFCSLPTNVNPGAPGRAKIRLTEDQPVKATISLLALAFGFLIFPHQARAEFRTAKDMQKECREVFDRERA